MDRTMMANGNTHWLMVMAHRSTLEEIGTKASGKPLSSKVLVKLHLPMGTAMLAHTLMENTMGMAGIHGQMAVNMRGTS